MPSTILGTPLTDDSMPSPIQDGLIADSRPTRLKNPVGGQIRLFQLLMGLFLVAMAAVLPLGIAAVARPEPSGFDFALLIVGICLGTFGLIAGFVLFVIRFYRKRFDRELADLEENALVHWVCTDDEWRSFVAGETSNAKQIALGGAGGLAVFGLIAGVITACNGVLVAGSTFLSILVMTCGGGLLGLLLGGIVQAAMLRRCRKMENEIGETLIGENGLYFSGNYYPWSMLGQRLVSVEVDEETRPVVLEFLFRVQNSNGPIDNRVRVPVPAGDEVVAAAIAASLG